MFFFASRGETAMFYAEANGFENVVMILKRQIEKKRTQPLTNNLKAENYTDVISAMKAQDSGVPLKTKKFFLITYSHVFEGKLFHLGIEFIKKG